MVALAVAPVLHLLQAIHRSAGRTRTKGTKTFYSHARATRHTTALASFVTKTFPDEKLNQERLHVPYLVRLLDIHVVTRPCIRLLLTDTESVLFSRGSESISRTPGKTGTLVSWDLASDWASRDHAAISRLPNRAGYEIEDRGSKNGTFINGTAITRRQLKDGDLLEVGGSMFLYRNSESVRPGAAPVREMKADALFIGDSLRPALEEVLAKLSLAAKTKEPILLTGDTGTGKEVYSKWIHSISGRKGDFVAVNCGAIPKELAESELFGAAKGAFSGATEARLGVVRQANRGTLLLDEIGELPLLLQTKLLRVLEQYEVRPVGASAPVKVDFRLVCATHRDLEAMVQTGNFREDLLARIRVVSAHLSPLSERLEDLGGLLCNAIPEELRGETTIDRDTFREIFRHEWPQNIRELRQTVRGALAIEPSKKLVKNISLPQSFAGDMDLPQLQKLLRKHKGNVSAIARDVDKARVQVWRWCKRFDVDPNDFR